MVVKKKLDVRRFFRFEGEELDNPTVESPTNVELKEREPKSTTYDTLPTVAQENSFMLPPPSVQLQDNSHIDYEELQFGECIAKGWQGEVFKGRWRSETFNCAIKILTSTKLNDQELDEIYKEVNFFFSYKYTHIFHYK